jgi:hypothetical protein
MITEPQNGTCIGCGSDLNDEEMCINQECDYDKN